MATDTDIDPRELDHRSTADGIDVWLLWHRTLKRVFVRVHDTRTGDDFEVRVAAGESPLDVFHHRSRTPPPGAERRRRPTSGSRFAPEPQ
jgi:hypothetical protein